MYMGIKLSSPSIISGRLRSMLWMICSFSPFFSSMAMPNIHFLGNSASLAISAMGISLYMNTGSMERDSTAAFMKSSSLSIICCNPE